MRTLLFYGRQLLLLSLLIPFLTIILYWGCAPDSPNLLFMSRFMRSYALLLLWVLAVICIVQQESLDYSKRWIQCGGVFLGGIAGIQVIVWYHPALRCHWVALSAILWGVVACLQSLAYLLKQIGADASQRSLVLVMVASVWVGNLVLLAGIIQASTRSLRYYIIKLLLVSNPVVALENIFNHDPLRTPWFYTHCPLGSYYSFSYPSWETVAGVYVTIALLGYVMGYVVGCCSNRVSKSYN